MKICIVKLSAMGDIIHAMIALEFIKKAFNNSQIDWVVEAGFKSVLESNPNIDNILPINLKALKKNKSEFFTQYKLLKTYSKNNYDLIIDAQGLLKSAIVSKIIGAKKIAGFNKKSTREGIASLFYNIKINKAYQANAIERNMAVICEPLNIEFTKKDILNKKKFLYSSFNKNNYTYKYIVLVVGASKDNKIYPKEKFLQLIEKLEKNVIIIWGNESEKTTAKWLETNSSFAKIAPKLNLDELKNIIQNASLIIGGDTGPTHMGWALNIPSITIFGNTPEHRNTYLTEINKVVKSHSIVDPMKLDYNDFSIKDIEIDDILETYYQIFGRITF
jgi:heptosyltransferase-1